MSTERRSCRLDASHMAHADPHPPQPPPPASQPPPLPQAAAAAAAGRAPPPLAAPRGVGRGTGGTWGVGGRG
eukprot:CAMPEP_0183594226 /NCGR_PEP_ID=MMETSP0371-20130417/171277_1 /TAXON_ID=268820 /ORGANISM="Peridinium aciculiferum, Strain PAER-2" /LENGTH=71 /DNA_ID=CAMNT_0025805913 /DNA_START=31 /DNA_END=243 /DNA_ORIENTATION=+